MCFCGLKASPLFSLCGITLGSCPLSDPTVFMRKTTGGLYRLLLLPTFFSLLLFAAPLLTSLFFPLSLYSSTLYSLFVPLLPVFSASTTLISFYVVIASIFFSLLLSLSFSLIPHSPVYSTVFYSSPSSFCFYSLLLHSLVPSASTHSFS